MAFGDTPKPTSYTVNTGHAKCPDHLYMLDEGTGTTVTDRGKTGGVNLTAASASMWTSDTFAGQSCPTLTSNNTSNWRAAGTGLSFSQDPAVTNDGALIILIFKTDSATNPAAFENIAALANSANSTDFIRVRSQSTSTGYISTTYDDGLKASVTQQPSVDAYDQAWHFYAGRITQHSSDQVRSAVAIDGGTRASSTSSAGYGTALFHTLNQIALGGSGGSSPTSEFDGQLLAAFIYTSEAGASAWDQTFIDSLYADPWQFLNTSTLQNFQYQTRHNPLVRM